MDLFSEGIYSDAIGSLIRETVSNSLDANRESGSDNPVVVSLQQDNNLERRAFTLASLAMQQSASKLSGMRAQAAMLLKSGNPQEVVRLLTGQAQDSRLQLYLGLAQLELHQFNEALERLQKVVGEHPEIVEAQHALVETYEKLGQWWLAKQIINRLLLTESDHPQTQFQMAWQNEVSRQWDRAIKGYQQVLRLEPTDVQARLRLAALLYRYKKDFAEATRNLDEVRQRYLKYCRDRQRLELYFHLGNLNFLKKDYQHSVEFYTESLKAAPYFVPAMIQLSLASQQLQQPLQGLNELKQAYGTANQDLRVLVVLLRSMQKNSDEAEVARLLTEVVNQYPESLLLLLEQLRVYWNRQQFEEAERLLRRGLMEIHPNNEALLFQNVNEVILVDLWSDYHSLLQQFQKTQPKSAAVLTTLGIVESFMGARRQAEADLNKAIELEADFLPATTMLADHWLRFQQPKKAMALLNRNWSDSEGDRVPRLLLTEAWLALGQTQKAEMSMPPLNQQLNNWSCRQATAQMRLMQTQDYRRPDKNRQLFFNCAAEPIYYHPAIQLIFDSKLSEPY
jgi:tetratricopeptide (TPR) repeat protein